MNLLLNRLGEEFNHKESLLCRYRFDDHLSVLVRTVGVLMHSGLALDSLYFLKRIQIG